MENNKQNSITVEGWVAIDEFLTGGAYIHTEKPHSELREFCDTGDYQNEWVSGSKIYEIDRELFPEMTEESEPKKVRLTIEPIEE